MAEAKEKKVTERDKFMYEAAQLFMEQMDLDFIYRTKEGLLFERGEEQVVLKFIQKKNRVYREDVVEEIARFYDMTDAAEATDEVVDEVEFDETKAKDEAEEVAV